MRVTDEMVEAAQKASIEYGPLAAGRVGSARVRAMLEAALCEGEDAPQEQDCAKRMGDGT